MNLFKRERQTKQIEKNKDWDVIVIGGGATGLGVAIDSVTRGYKTILLEQVDFAKGTSSRSTKLVHGGVRYLAQGNVSLVKEALYERGLMLKNASHLVTNQSFIIPNYKYWERFLYTTGLKVYDFLSGKLSLGKSTYISKKETIKRLETINTNNLKGAVVYQDGQFDDSRLAINLAQTCIEKGATVLNYFKVKNLLKSKEGKVIGVVANDMETQKSYKLNAKAVINATGIFTDSILKMDTLHIKNIIRPSQGVHLVVDKTFLPGTDGMMLPKTEDNRVLFLVPWHDKVIVGTTDTVLEKASLEPKALKKEVEFILATANRYLIKKITKKDVLSVFSGLRPLAASDNKEEKTKEISRSHKIVISNSGLISVIGGKWTTYRKMAQDTIDKAIKAGILPNKKCMTKHLAIHGSTSNAIYNSHLHIYGSDQQTILEWIKKYPELSEKLHPRLSNIKAEVIWAIRNEMARTIEDILARRVRFLFLDAKAAIEVAPKVAEILATELHKSKEWEENQTKEFKIIAANYVID